VRVGEVAAVREVAGWHLRVAGKAVVVSATGDPESAATLAVGKNYDQSLIFNYPAVGGPFLLSVPHSLGANLAPDS